MRLSDVDAKAVHVDRIQYFLLAFPSINKKVTGLFLMNDLSTDEHGYVLV